MAKLKRGMILLGRTKRCSRTPNYSSRWTRSWSNS